MLAPGESPGALASPFHETQTILSPNGSHCWLTIAWGPVAWRVPWLETERGRRGPEGHLACPFPPVSPEGAVQPRTKPYNRHVHTRGPHSIQTVYSNRELLSPLSPTVYL